MHLLFISEYYPPKIKGGGEINLSTLAKALAASGQIVSILTSQFPNLPRYEEQEGVKIYRRLKTGENPGSISSNIARSLRFPSSVKKETKRLASEINPNILHFIGTSIIAAPKLKSLNKPLFATIESYPTLCPKGDRWYHGRKECRTICSLRKFASCQNDSDEIGKMKNKWYFKYNPFFLAYTYHYYKRLNTALSSCTLISISKYVQQLLLQQNHQSTVIPNILDLKPFTLAKKKSSDKSAEKENKKEKKAHILYLGSLIKSKGPHILLEALKGINCHCDLYGEGNLKSELQEYIRKNNLDAEIHPPVPYEKIPELYAETDIVVFPSIWPEPFGRIAIEAMAAGKMVVASDIGAIVEIVGEKGILILPGDALKLHLILNNSINKNLNKKVKIVSDLKEIKKKMEFEYGGKTILDILIKTYKKINFNKITRIALLITHFVWAVGQ